MFKKLIILYIPLLLNAKAQEQNYVKENFDKVEEYITMRDGTKLFTSIYIPKDHSQKYPILLNRTPYTVSPYGINEYKTSLGNFPEMMKAGYIFVYQDVRGKWISEGIFENIRPTKSIINKHKIDESTDTYDTIDWLVKNLKQSNKKVGMYGISYPGFYATAALIDSHPALKAVSPQAPVTDWFIGDDFRHGGALFLMDAFKFMYTFDAKRPKPITNANGPESFQLADKDYYKFFLENGNIKNIKERYLNHTVKFWNDLEKHQTRDTFWNDRTITNYVTNVKPAVMVVGGLFDAEDTYGAFETYKQIELKNKHNNNILVAGPWYHGGWVRSEGDYFGDIKFGEKTSITYQQKFELPFFEYYLKGKGEFKPAEANIYITGENKWNSFTQWPPKEVNYTPYYLSANGSMSKSKSAELNSYITYTTDPQKPIPFQEGIIAERSREYMIADQRFVANRPDVIVFQTDKLDKDITLTGPIIANLKISMSGTDADFIVKLIDVYPDSTNQTSPSNKTTVMQNYQMLVRADVLRGRFRNGFDKPSPFTPNQITDVNVTLPDIAHTFKKGHKLMLQIQNTWFPLVDRNPNQYIDTFKAEISDYIKNEINIYTSDNNSSNIILPILNK